MKPQVGSEFASDLFRVSSPLGYQVVPTWLQVIKLYGCLHGFDEVLAANRKRSDSLSANKVSAVKGTWFLYTEIEGLSKPYAGYCLFWQMFHAVLKRIGKR